MTLRDTITAKADRYIMHLKHTFPDWDISLKIEGTFPAILISNELNFFTGTDLWEVGKFVNARELSFNVIIEDGKLTISIT